MAISQIGTASISGLGYGFKNRIINGAMMIDQRNAGTAVTVTTTTSGTYGPDRTSGYTGTGSLWQLQRVSTGNLDFPYASRIQRISGQTSTSGIYWRQVIETSNCSDLAGQTVALSFYVTAGSNYSGGAVTVNIYTGTAADQGTASLNTGAWTGLATPLNSTFTPTTTRTRYTFTATIGSSVQEIAIGLYWAGSGTAGTNDYIDVTGVQLEAGTVATTFDYRPYGTELALCQRYYEKTLSQGTTSSTGQTSGALIGVATATTQMAAQWSFKQTKRTTPTLTLSSFNGTSGSWSSVSSNADFAVTQPWGVGDSGFARLDSTGMTAGAGYWGFAVASAEL